MSAWIRVIDTPTGPARIHVDRAFRPEATLVLGHGASGGVDARDLVSLTSTLPRRHQITVIRVVQPWLEEGKKAPPSQAVLDEAWLAVLGYLRGRAPLIVGGRSVGARVACRTARQAGALGCVALSFPLHPPGKPEKSNVDELLGTGLPTLIVQGERDPYGTPYELPFGADVAVVPSAGHDFSVPKAGPISQTDAIHVVIESVASWILHLVEGRRNHWRAEGVIARWNRSSSNK